MCSVNFGCFSFFEFSLLLLRFVFSLKVQARTNKQQCNAVSDCTSLTVDCGQVGGGDLHVSPGLRPQEHGVQLPIGGVDEEAGDCPPKPGPVPAP